MKSNDTPNPYLPKEVVVENHIQVCPNLFTLELEFTNPEDRANYHVKPGQFNMLYAYGMGEVPISVVSDPTESGPLAHSIRALGSVTQALANLKPGDRLGLRGPFGKGWPMQQLIGKDIIVITGGIGSAPVIGAIHEVMRDREHYGRLTLAHGVSNPDEMIYQDYYAQWQQAPNTEVLLACHSKPSSPYSYQGLVTDFIHQMTINNPEETLCLMCGPRLMMRSSVEKLMARAIPASNIFLSLERNMQCGLGHCGHCQCGDKFTCQDGPVFAWDSIADFVLSDY